MRRWTALRRLTNLRQGPQQRPRLLLCAALCTVKSALQMPQKHLHVLQGLLVPASNACCKHTTFGLLHGPEMSACSSCLLVAALTGGFGEQSCLHFNGPSGEPTCCPNCMTNKVGATWPTAAVIIVSFGLWTVPLSHLGPAPSKCNPCATDAHQIPCKFTL